jgi:hypothetical protein
MARTPKWLIAVLGALFCGAVAWAQEEEAPPPAPATPVPCYGTVFLPDGSPAAEAEVEFAVWGKDYVEATTDAAGGYRAMLPDAGTLVVEARIRGVAISKRLVVRAADPEHAVALDVHLHAAPVLSGVVYTQGGAPAANMALRGYGMRGRTNYVPPADGIPPTQVDYGGGWTNGGMPVSVTTDGLGRYSVPLLDIGCETNGWPPPSVDADGTEYNLVLVAPEGQGWARLQCRVGLDTPEMQRDIRLQPGARVRGTVIGYPGGAPMAGVHVQVGTDVPGDITGHGGPATVEEVVTDEEGRFQASAAIPPELLRVVARPPAGWAVMIEGWPRPDPAPGDRYVEIALLRDPVIEGQVFGPDGSALANAHVAFGNRLEADTDDGGRYRLQFEPDFGFYGQPPARWRYLWLSARAPHVGVATPAWVDLTKEPLCYDFHLSPPATVTGNEIEEDEGIKAVGVRVRLVPAVEGAPPRELEAASGLCFDEEHSVAKDDDSGVYRLEGVPPGEYWLETSDWTVHSLTVEEGNAIRVTVPPGGGTVTVDTFAVDYLPRFNVRLLRGPSDLASYEVTGFARAAGSSGPGSEIFVWHWPGEQDRYLVWARGLYPGRYELAIVARGEAVRCVTAVQTMDLTGDPPGEDLSFDLGGAAVSGRVVLPDGVTGIPHVTVTGRAVAGDAVLLNGEMSDWAHFQVDTDESGRFTITGLLPGEYEVRAHLPEEFYGASPTARVRVRVNDRVGVVLRAEKVDW